MLLARLTLLAWLTAAAACVPAGAADVVPPRPAIRAADFTGGQFHGTDALRTWAQQACAADDRARETLAGALHEIAGRCQGPVPKPAYLTALLPHLRVPEPLDLPRFIRALAFERQLRAAHNRAAACHRILRRLGEGGQPYTDVFDLASDIGKYGVAGDDADAAVALTETIGGQGPPAPICRPTLSPINPQKKD